MSNCTLYMRRKDIPITTSYGQLHNDLETLLSIHDKLRTLIHVLCSIVAISRRVNLDNSCNSCNVSFYISGQKYIGLCYTQCYLVSDM